MAGAKDKVKQVISKALENHEFFFCKNRVQRHDPLRPPSQWVAVQMTSTIISESLWRYSEIILGSESFRECGVSFVSYYMTEKISSL